MRTPSERQNLIRDVFLVMAYHHHEETENLLDMTMGLPTIPSFSSILFPTNPQLQFVWEMLFEDETEASEILDYILHQRYLQVRGPPTTHEEYDLGRLFDMREDDFKQAVRTTRSGFVWLLNKIRGHPVFCTRLPISGHKIQTDLPPEYLPRLSSMPSWHQKTSSCKPQFVVEAASRSE
ncbi:hypothetical protein MJO28_004078 [Puccinia striiformis f. sp. tritici]|uniref:Uncharacterized protein n=2 Tax=Puccinia striiformis f. sp. tritici TaxID=168172 RepID=A0A0L0VPS1_9BASI|nr:hypothetical protein MJO28_004078 [Puccinia striiformis f. sp. tritici]KNF01288.1 hypothetical protein PSTG_05385 [Puccinia striiformis f. sp. tritici PST-78]